MKPLKQYQTRRKPLKVADDAPIFRNAKGIPYTPQKFIVTEEEMAKMEAEMKKFKSSYTLIISGNVRTIINSKGHSWTGINLRENSKNGYHLCTLVRKEVEKYVEINGVAPYTKPYREQLFNVPAIKNNIGKPLIAVDIRNCYWRTLILKGFISQKLYLQGLRKSEWKVGRNASVGSLAKQECKMQYLNGKLITNTKEFSRPPIALQYVRNTIVGGIYEMFYRLYQEIGDDFVYFLTDCVFVPPHRAEYVRKFLWQEGYQVKMKTVEITQFDEEKQKLFWRDFEKEKDRYYSFSDKQKLP